jgi:hypothetical protein
VIVNVKPPVVAVVPLVVGVANTFCAVPVVDAVAEFANPALVA